MNGTGYPYKICSKGRLNIGDAKSTSNSKNVWANLRKVFACTVTYIYIGGWKGYIYRRVEGIYIFIYRRVEGYIYIFIYVVVRGQI